MRRMKFRWMGGFAVLIALAAQTALLAGDDPRPLPAPLDGYVKSSVRLTAEKQKLVLAGQPVTQVLGTDSPSEVAIFGIVWVKAPIARYLTAVKDIEAFEKGDSFLMTKRISNSPQLDDFDRLSIPPDDLADLKTCKVGKCQLKLSEEALTRIQKETDWSKPTAKADAERSVRKLMLDYVTAYQAGGNSRLAVYRDSQRPTFVAQEFESMVNRMPSLTTYLPELKKYLLEYPEMKLPNAESFLYWQDAKFGLKPTVRINHLTIADEQTHATVVSKMLYASHYFWTAIELRVLVPDPARGEGFWFATVNQSRSDGLTGFTGSVIRGRVVNEAEKGIQTGLRITKARMEGLTMK